MKGTDWVFVAVIVALVVGILVLIGWASNEDKKFREQRCTAVMSAVHTLPDSLTVYRVMPECMK